MIIDFIFLKKENTIIIRGVNDANKYLIHRSTRFLPIFFGLIHKAILHKVFNINHLVTLSTRLLLWWINV